jgi:hypothetical protein
LLRVGDGRKSPIYAHRYSWELAHGPIPPGKFVCHRCDNPPCVRPGHLFLGTQLENIADMIAKGRREYASVPNTTGYPRLRVLSLRLSAAEFDMIDSMRRSGEGFSDVARRLLIPANIGGKPLR